MTRSSELPTSMMEWRNYHVHYADLDRLLVECVYPLLRTAEDELTTCFWERHYAGGPHLRVRFRGTPERLAGICEAFVAKVGDYLAAHPSVPLHSYSAERAAAMAAMENETLAPADLVYRCNEICARPYQRIHHNLASDDAAVLAEDFLHDSMPLAAEVLRSGRPKREQVLQLYFLQALALTGDVPRGCVSYKSHWEGFAATLATPAVIDRVHATYLRQAGQIRELMLEVVDRYRAGDVGGEPLLVGWLALVNQYQVRARTAIESGLHVTVQARTRKQARESRRRAEGKLRRDSAFLRVLWSDERFMALIQYDQRFLTPRIMTNLLYFFVSAVGLNALDKMSLCYYAHRAAEEHYECDLNQILERTIARVVEEHAHRLVER